jgi:hypothetical protein
VAEKLLCLPEYDEQQARSGPAEVRRALLQNLKQLFVPLPRHFELEQSISNFIRGGYVSRNPLAGQFDSATGERVSDFEKSIGTIPDVCQPLDSAVLVGVSGTGKSYSVSRILSLTPQIFRHASYKGIPFEHTQLTWLRLDCPNDASPRALCVAFFEMVDRLLQTNYLPSYGGRHETKNTMLPSLGRVALLHSLGLLVIDEIQNLSHAKAGGRAETLNFIVQIVNTLGVPVLLIGTPHAATFLGHEFRLARRSSGLAQPEWLQMEENSAEWQTFSSVLWGYQYTQQKAELTDEIRRVLYYETQGITDFVVKLYFLAQQRAINAGTELVTAGLIRDIAREAFIFSRPILDALRRKDRVALQRAGGDISPVKLVNEAHPAQPTLPGLETASQPTGDTATEPIGGEAPPQPKGNAKARGKNVKNKPAADSLMAIAAAAKAKGQDAYSAIKEAEKKQGGDSLAAAA